MWLIQRLIGMLSTQSLFLVGYVNTHTAISLSLPLCHWAKVNLWGCMPPWVPPRYKTRYLLLLDSTDHGHYSQLRWGRIKAKVHLQRYHQYFSSVLFLWLFSIFPFLYPMGFLFNTGWKTLAFYFFLESFVLILTSCFEIFRSSCLIQKCPRF